MKTKIFRAGKRTLSIVLTLMMLLTMLVVPVNAATIDEEPVAAVTTYYLWYSLNGNEHNNMTNMVTMTSQGDGTYICDFTSGGNNYGFTITTSNSSAKTNLVSKPTAVTCDSALSNWVNCYNNYYSNVAYWYGESWASADTSVRVTYTPSSNSIHLSKASSVVTPTDPTYYITGRFAVKNNDDTYSYSGVSSLDSTDKGWNGDLTSDIKFTKSSESDTLYYLDTNLTINDITNGRTNDGGNIWYFQISDGTAKYRPSTASDLPLSATDAGTTYSTGTSNGSFYFTGTDTSGNVILYFDSSSKTFYFEIENTDDPDETTTLKSGTTVYVRSKKEIASATLTSTLNTASQETAVVMTEAGDVNGYYYYSYTLTADADSITFDITYDDDSSSTGSYTASCVKSKDVYDINSSTWSTYEIDKSSAYSSGLWVDTQPSIKNSSLALIKWTDKSGPNGKSDTYRLYLPSGVTPSELPIYSKFNSLTIGGTSVSNGSAYSGLTASTTGDSFTVIGDGTSYSLKVYQSESPSIYTYTGNDLPTKAYGYKIDKPTEKNGAFMTVDKSGSIKNELMTLSQIKGRGNSSWESSGKLFGKYAYNIKLSSKINPLDMGGTEAKSFCLLANTMDEALLRNMVTFQIGEDSGLPFTPNFKSVDLYNNGEYLGAYLITEKVDIGGSKLVDGDTVEDYHVYDDDTAEKITDTYTNSYGSGSYQYINTGDYIPAAGETSESYKNKSYLLEFDLKSRATSENSWFQTPKGQYVAIKAYEDLNQAEMKFIIEKWCAAEDAVYKGDYNTANSLMDLDSFAQVYLVQELSKNLDAGATSYYIYYDGTQSSPKWQATPLWDYDWAYGEYTKGGTKPADTNGDNFTSDLTSTSGWFAKYKYITYEGTYTEDTSAGLSSYKYNLQAQLANMSDFWDNNVKGVWNDSFYQSAVGVFGTTNNTDAKIDTFYSSNSSSFRLNETRYGFISNNPLISNNWGSQSTGKNTEDTYEYLKNWGIERINWMATTGGLGIPTYNPVLESVTLETSKSTVDVNEEFTLTATPSPNTVSDVTYKFYEDNTELTSHSNTITISKDTAGTYTYYVTATVNDLTVSSEEISVTVNASTIPELTDVALESSTTTVALNGTFELTATATPSNVDCTYVFYKSTDNSVSDDDTVLISSGNKATVTANIEGTFYYYVVATDSNDSSKKFTSELISVQAVASGETLESVTIKLKGTSLASLAPSVSVNGADKATMTKSTNGYIGTHYSGSYQFYWFETTLNNVDVGETYTLTFTTANSDMNASVDVIFLSTDTVRYFAVDNMQTGTKAEDITGNPTKQICFRSSVNMINNVMQSNDPSYIRTSQAALLTFKTLAGKAVTKKCYLGDVDTDNSLSVNDVTAIQFYLVGSSDLDDNNSILCDYNMDGVVDVNDATAIQLRLAGIH